MPPGKLGHGLRQLTRELNTSRTATADHDGHQSPLQLRIGLVCSRLDVSLDRRPDALGVLNRVQRDRRFAQTRDREVVRPTAERQDEPKV